MSVLIEGRPASFDAFDPYWAPYIYLDRTYEPEVEMILDELGSLGPALFIDCGANFGYWSSQVSSGKFGQHDVIAVEASESTYQRLVKNVPSTVVVRHAAISDQVGQVSFDDSLSHAGRRISVDGTSHVAAVTIDDLAEHRAPLLIKLDVEGAEEVALVGASRALERQTAFIYEDHGSDPECAASAAMLAAGLDVFAISAGVTQVYEVDQVAAMKVSSVVGYNFVACNGAFALACRELAESQV